MIEPRQVSEPAFVGRERELEILEARLRDASLGRARFLVLAGEAGIGKTRTAEELVARAGLPGNRVVWGRAPEQAGAPSYWPWARAIDEYASAAEVEALREELAEDGPVLAHLVPGLRTRLPEIAPVALHGSDVQARFRVLDAVAGFLQRATRRAPLIVVLEDVHWADEASLTLLAFVVRELRTARLLMLATYREGEPRRAPRALTDAVHAGERIRLRGLDRAAVESLVARVTAAAPPPSLVTRLHELTDGNPFFLDEVLRVARGEGHLDDEALLPESLALPESVRATLRRRLEPLAAEDRELLEVAAVVGREFDMVVLREVTGLPPEDVLARLAAAAADGLVEEGPAVGRFRFAHALVRETLYGELLPAARARLHQRVAMALEALHGGDSDPPLTELARHFCRAAPLGMAAKAVEYAVRAAEQAATLGAYDDAMVHYERALSALALQAPDERRRLRVWLGLGDAAWRAGRNLRARQAFEEVARRARALGDQTTFALAAMRFVRASPLSGAPDPVSVALLETALDATADVEGSPRALLLAMLAQALYFSSERERCLATSVEALALARRGSDPIALATALLSRQLLLVGPGDASERLALGDESRAVAQAAGFDQAVHLSRLSRTLALLELGRIAEANDEIEHMRHHAERTHLSEWLWHATVHRASLAILAGRFDDGARLAAEALAIRRDASDPGALHIFTVQAFLCRIETGDAASLEGSIRHLIADFPAVPAWRCALAVLLVDADRLAEARALVDALAPDHFAAVRRDFLYPAALAWLAQVAAALNDAAYARTLYRLLEPFAERNLVVSVYSPGCLGSAHRYLALLADTLGDVQRAVEHAEAALATNARLGARAALAGTQHEQARRLGARDGAGDREHARALRSAARETAEACGMTKLAAALVDPVSGAAEPSLEPRPPAAASVEAVLSRDTDYWRVGYGHARFQLKDTKGLSFLHTLLRHPGREFHVLDLAGGGEPAADGASRAAAGDAGEMLDPAARAAYKRRLEDLRETLGEAQSFNDLERAARAEHEIDFLTEELARAVGLGGRSRKAASAAERARVNVSRTLGAVVKKIAANSPALGQHLNATVRTGYFCSYTPDPRVAISWQF
jgi:AAA ATPase domain